MRTLLLVVAIIALAVPAFCAETAAPAVKTATTAVAAVAPITGLVKNVDTAKKVISIDVAGKVQDVAVAADAKITKAGMVIALDAIKAGDKVTVDGKNIMVLPAMPAPSAVPAAK